MIEVQHLAKRYGGHTAVRDLSFTLEPGKVYGFLGPNGAGKSTTMNIMTGYLAPSGGEVLFDGVSLLEEPTVVKAKIGYLPEQPPLYIDMTVQEYLDFAAALKKVPRDQRGSQLARIMEVTQLTDVSGRLIKNLSKGYRQRVGLAQALVGSPELIILDEPTVGLDPKQIIEIRALIRDLAREHTVVLSSHILSEVQEVCDYVFIIHHGELVAQGEPAELESALSGGVSLILTVQGDGADLMPALEGISGVDNVVLAKSAPGETCLEIQCEADSDPRVAVFRACVAADRPILELNRQSMTLEDIFLELTADSAAPEEKDAGSQPENLSGGSSASDGAPLDAAQEEEAND